MPRIYASNNDPLDFCQDCFPLSEDEARMLYAGDGEGPDDRGDYFTYDAEHPPYDETDYTCHACGCKLTADDDIADLPYDDEEYDPEAPDGIGEDEWWDE